jgi:hypothetical protein
VRRDQDFEHDGGAGVGEYDVAVVDLGDRIGHQHVIRKHNLLLQRSTRSMPSAHVLHLHGLYEEPYDGRMCA